MNQETKLVEELIKHNWHIAFAESCTGGLAVAQLINVPNASYVLNASFITYSNESKIKYLSVSNDTIIKHGVVSNEVALEMALGVAKETNSEIGVGISGIAGPAGATETKPVGMVSFGFVIGSRNFAITKQFGNIGRQEVRKASVDFVYETLLEIIQKESNVN